MIRLLYAEIKKLCNKSISVSAKAIWESLFAGVDFIIAGSEQKKLTKVSVFENDIHQDCNRIVCEMHWQIDSHC